MSDEPDPQEEAAAALIDIGLRVVPQGYDQTLWDVGEMTFSDCEVLALAMQFGLVRPP